MSVQLLTTEQTWQYWLDTPLTRVPLVEPLLHPDAVGNELQTVGRIDDASKRFGKYLGRHQGGFVVWVYRESSFEMSGGEKFSTFEDLCSRWIVD